MDRTRISMDNSLMAGTPKPIRVKKQPGYNLIFCADDLPAHIPRYKRCKKFGLNQGNVCMFPIGGFSMLIIDLSIPPKLNMTHLGRSLMTKKLRTG
jgi:hypothetical protein